MSNFRSSSKCQAEREENYVRQVGRKNTPLWAIIIKRNQGQGEQNIGKQVVKLCIFSPSKAKRKLVALS